MAPYKPPENATVIDDSGLVSVYRMADGQILFVDETHGVPFGIFGTLLLRLFFLTTFMLLATAPAIVGADIPATWLWYLSGTVIAVMALLIAGYFKHIRIWGRWHKQRELYYEPGAQQWYWNGNRLAAFGNAPTLEVVSDTYRDRYRPSETEANPKKYGRKSITCICGPATIPTICCCGQRPLKKPVPLRLFWKTKACRN